MFHRVQALLSVGKSQRAISRELGINRRTVKKLAEMQIPEAAQYFERRVQRISGFDQAREYIESKLSAYNGLRASNLYHQVMERYPEIRLSERAFRSYITKLKAGMNSLPSGQRYFEPVTDWKPGKHMQVDPGEKSVMLLDGSRMKVYFVSFVMCYSRQMYVHFSSKPYNTELFIDAHLSAFQYFGGIAHTGIYDQTKLVAIREEYREVVYNERFQQFCLRFGFYASVCEGYDPQSKGMVEKSVGYIKGSFLDGREFSGVEDIRRQSESWLNTIANCREHRTTLRKPVELFAEEQKHLLSVGIDVYPSEQRKVDKTGLINYRGYSYSVPYLYQMQQVRVRNCDGILHVYDVATEVLITTWDLSLHKLRINKNEQHYINLKTSISEEYALSEALFKKHGFLHTEELLRRLGADHPNHVRAQYQGLRKLLGKYDVQLWEAEIGAILALPLISCTRLDRLFKLKLQRSAWLKSKPVTPNQTSPTTLSNSFRDLSYYDRLILGDKS